MSEFNQFSVTFGLPLIMFHGIAFYAVSSQCYLLRYCVYCKQATVVAGKLQTSWQSVDSWKKQHRLNGGITSFVKEEEATGIYVTGI